MTLQRIFACLALLGSVAHANSVLISGPQTRTLVKDRWSAQSMEVAKASKLPDKTQYTFFYNMALEATLVNCKTLALVSVELPKDACGDDAACKAKGPQPEHWQVNKCGKRFDYDVAERQGGVSISMHAPAAGAAAKADAKEGAKDTAKAAQTKAGEAVAK